MGREKTSQYQYHLKDRARVKNCTKPPLHLPDVEKRRLSRCLVALAHLLIEDMYLIVPCVYVSSITNSSFQCAGSYDHSKLCKAWMVGHLNFPPLTRPATVPVNMQMSNEKIFWCFLRHKIWNRTHANLGTTGYLGPIPYSLPRPRISWTVPLLHTSAYSWWWLSIHIALYSLWTTLKM